VVRDNHGSEVGPKVPYDAEPSAYVEQIMDRTYNCMQVLVGQESSDGSWTRGIYDARRRGQVAASQCSAALSDI
jgi:hypothetical protein